MSGKLLQCNDLEVFGSVAQLVEQRRFDPLLKSPTLPIGEPQPTEDKALTPTGKSGDKSENPNLVSGLFSKNELEPDFLQLIEAWPSLPEHIKAAIKALVQTHKTEKE